MRFQPGPAVAVVGSALVASLLLVDYARASSDEDHGAVTHPHRCPVLADVPPPGSCSFDAAGHPSCASGDTDTDERDELCVAGGTQGARCHPSKALRRALLAAYSLEDGDYEIDHRIEESLGGAQTIQNLYPQRAPDYHWKDAVEAELHRRYCAGDVSLDAARAILLGDWMAYLRAMKAGKPK